MTALLDQLQRRCRHSPRMGGNREQITVTCGLLGRLISVAEMAKAMSDPEWDAGYKAALLERIADELAHIDGEIKWMKEVQK